MKTIEVKISNEVSYYDPENTMTEQEYEKYLNAFMYNVKNLLGEYFNDGTEDFEVVVTKGFNQTHQINTFGFEEDDYIEESDFDEIMNEAFSRLNECF